MTPRPDPLTLDEMILGTLDDDLDPWIQLLASPDGTRRWHDAHMRRRSLDGGPFPDVA